LPCRLLNGEGLSRNPSSKILDRQATGKEILENSGRQGGILGLMGERNIPSLAQAKQIV
jgi:hypothetical protein